jgi:hypothetical protein
MVLLRGRVPKGRSRKGTANLFADPTKREASNQIAAVHGMGASRSGGRRMNSPLFGVHSISRGYPHASGTLFEVSLRESCRTAKGLAAYFYALRNSMFSRSTTRDAWYVDRGRNVGEICNLAWRRGGSEHCTLSARVASIQRDYKSRLRWSHPVRRGYPDTTRDAHRVR